MFRLSKFEILAPIDSTSGGGGSPSIGSGGISGVNVRSGSGEMSKDDMIDFMSDDEPEKEQIPLEEITPKSKPPKDTGKKVDDEEEEDTETKEDETEEVDELKEIEDELQEPTEEQLELVTPVRRREILKKYPNLFKDFPYLEKAYYREQQYTELLPTIVDAREAVEKSQTLDRFEQDVISGNTETILRAVKETDPNSFNKIVDNYLPTLKKVDENAYFHVISNVSKHTIVAMAQEAQRTKNQQLQAAAHILNQFVFGTSEFQPPTNLAKPEKPEDKSRENKISEREQKFIQQRFETSRDELNTRVNNSLRNTIEAHIDPKESMSDYVRKNASRDALDTLEDIINKDSRFKNLVDKLWEKAFQEDFSKPSIDRIRSAYVSKAKTLLPSVIKKARNEALRGMGKRVREDEETTSKKGPIAAGRPRSQTPTTGRTTNAKEIPKGMSTLEFLNSD